MEFHGRRIFSFVTNHHVVFQKVLVIQSCPTFCDHTDCNSQGSSVHEILQARILEWVAIPLSCLSEGLYYFEFPSSVNQLMMNPDSSMNSSINEFLILPILSVCGDGCLLDFDHSYPCAVVWHCCFKVLCFSGTYFY